MELTIQDMRKLADILITHAEKLRVKKMPLDYDYYIKVPLKKTSNFIDNPQENYVIGSLYDDVEDLKKVLSGEYEPTTVDIEKFGAIMTALGQQIIK
jgi:hypothetical protein